MEDDFVVVCLAVSGIVVVVLLILFIAQRKTIGRLQTEIELRAKQQYDDWRTCELESIRQEQRAIAWRKAGVALQQ